MVRCCNCIESVQMPFKVQEFCHMNEFQNTDQMYSSISIELMKRNIIYHSLEVHFVKLNLSRIQLTCIPGFPKSANI